MLYCSWNIDGLTWVFFWSFRVPCWWPELAAPYYLTPLDFFLRGSLESQINDNKPTTTQTLKTLIKCYINEIPRRECKPFLKILLEKYACDTKALAFFYWLCCFIYILRESLHDKWINISILCFRKPCYIEIKMLCYHFNTL